VLYGNPFPLQGVCVWFFLWQKSLAVVCLCAFQTNNEIRDMDRIIQLIRRSIHDKELTLKVAQTRLEERTRRRCIELCRDQPMVGSVEPHVLYHYQTPTTTTTDSTTDNNNNIDYDDDDDDDDEDDDYDHDHHDHHDHHGDYDHDDYDDQMIIMIWKVILFTPVQISIL